MKSSIHQFHLTNLAFFPTGPGEFFASKLELTDFGVEAADEPSLLANAELRLIIIVLVSGVVSNCVSG